MDLRATIFDTADRNLQAVPTPEWPEVDGKLWVRGMSGLQRDRYEQAVLACQGTNGKVSDLSGMKALIVLLTTVDSLGQSVFEDTDLELLQEKSASAINRLADVSLSLSGFTQSDVEELEKN